MRMRTILATLVLLIFGGAVTRAADKFEPTPESLFLVREEVFGDVVGAVDDGDDTALVVASDGMTEQLCPVPPKIAQDDARRGRRLGRIPVAGWDSSL